jgi:hypothetical protein
LAFVQKQLIPITFGGGVNTKTDSKQLAAGQLLTLQDGQFSKAGQINKRFGYNALNTNIQGGSAIAAGVELAAYKDELLLFDGNNVYSYLDSTETWSNRGTAISVITEDKDIIRVIDAQQLNPDCNYLDGILVFAWEDSRGAVRYSVIDQETGAFIVSDTPISISAQQPKVIAFSGLILIFYCTSGNLNFKYINPATPNTLSTPTTIATDGYAGFNGFPYDVCVSNGYLYCSYLGTDSATVATGAIQAFYLTPGSFFQSSFIVIESAVGKAINSIINAGPASFMGAINIVGDSGNNLWISWSDGYHVRTSLYTNLLASQTLADTIVATTASNILCGIESPTALTLLLCYENDAALYSHSRVISPQMLQTATISPSGTVIQKLTIRSAGISSKPFIYLNNIYVNGCYDSPNNQSTDFTFLIGTYLGGALTTYSIVAQETPGVGGGIQTNGMCPETVKLETGIFIFANLQAGKILSEGNTLFSLLGVNSTTLNFSTSNQFLNTTQANTLLIVGGILQGYDGVSVVETGFLVNPETIGLTDNSGGGSLSAGTYQYVQTYAWTDNYGQIYESAPCSPVSITVSAGDSVTVNGTTLRLSNKGNTRSAAVINIYRTQANGTTFNLITSSIAPLVNNPAVDGWTFVDSLADANAETNQLIYTTGSVLMNIAPPANSILITYNNRVFLSGMSDKLLIWYSQSVVSNATTNTIPPQFCAELNESCDPRGGDIMGLGVLNNALVIFKESQIFSFAGNGPDATGNNSDYGDPVYITSDVGCISANSIVATPQGLMFQSAKGIYLLDQSANLTYIGAPVEAFNDLTITSATLHSNYNQVIFTSDSGTALVYDYYFNQWSTWSNHFAADAVIYNGSFTYLNPNGTVMVQNTSSFTDAGFPIFLSWTTPNLNFAGIQGYQRVFKFFILGNFYGTHTLDVSIAYDFDPNYIQFATVTPSDGYTTADGWQIYEFRIDTKIQKCTSIRINVVDNQTSTYNQGYAISSLVFEVGALPGGNRLPVVNTIGAQ